MKKKTSTEKIPTEDQEQAWLVAWFKGQYPDFRLFAIPNGGKRHIKTAMLMKATGVEPGVPDLFLPAAMHPYHGLFIEMKRQKGGRLTPQQKDWKEFLGREGYKVVVCPGFEAAKREIIEYLGG